MDNILKPEWTLPLAVRFCSASPDKKGLMRTLMHIVHCGYPPGTIGAVVERFSMKKSWRALRGYPVIEDGHRAPNVVMWHRMTCSAYSHKALSN